MRPEDIGLARQWYGSLQTGMNAGYGPAQALLNMRDQSTRDSKPNVTAKREECQAQPRLSSMRTLPSTQDKLSIDSVK
jgi:hypothetical protein